MLARGLERRDTSSERNRTNGVFKGRGRRRIPGAIAPDRLKASYCVAIWKMLRKKGCVPSALTQNVKDFLASPEIENIFENSDFLVLLSQAQGDRQILAKQLGISPHQLSYVTHTNSGEGLLFFGNTTIPFVDRFPQNIRAMMA